MSELTPEVKQQLAEQKKQCPFCKIIAGEIPAKKVYNDSLVSAILDINPASEGHTLVMPKEHYPIMPFITPKEFNHLFGLMPRFAQAVKDSMLCSGLNIMIANGGVAGQQSPHFLLHLIPRDRGDWKDKYSFDSEKPLDQEKFNQAGAMLAQNIPVMMNNHFQRQPASWRTEQPKTAEYLNEIKANSIPLYEDDKAIVFIPTNPQSIGHLVVYSNTGSELTDLSFEDSAHLFYVASYCATAVFEGLGAHGTNIIVKSGFSDDNPTGVTSIHIIPRYQDDGLDLIIPPMQNKPNNDSIAEKISDKMFYIEHEMKEANKKEEKIVINLDENQNKPQVIGQSSNNNSNSNSQNPISEIKQAIDEAKRRIP